MRRGGGRDKTSDSGAYIAQVRADKFWTRGKCIRRAPRKDARSQARSWAHKFHIRSGIRARERRDSAQSIPGKRSRWSKRIPRGMYLPLQPIAVLHKGIELCRDHG